jgi:hypothetical protein
MQEAVYNPLSKERIVFRESTDEVFAMDLYVEPGGGIRAPDHIHPRQEERLRIAAGSARFRVDREERYGLVEGGPVGGESCITTRRSTKRPLRSTRKGGKEATIVGTPRGDLVRDAASDGAAG